MVELPPVDYRARAMDDLRDGLDGLRRELAHYGARTIEFRFDPFTLSTWLDVYGQGSSHHERINEVDLVRIGAGPVGGAELFRGLTVRAAQWLSRRADVIDGWY